MARLKEREDAIKLRDKGFSYSQIKDKLGISKSTLSGWLYDRPLSKERINELQANSHVRIEKTRETKRKKKEERKYKVFQKVANDIKKSNDTFFVSGFYLYWGEGTKTAEYTVSFTNSDPAMVRCFVHWISLLGISSSELRTKLHLYSDQNERKLKKFWADATGIPQSNFNKTYVKQNSSARKTYKGMFSFGTCVVAYHDRDIHEYVLGGIKYLQQKHGLPYEFK